MKKSILFSIVFSLSTCNIINAQTVDIPDPEFLDFLISKGVDLNGDSQIQLEEASTFSDPLDIRFTDIVDITGIENFDAVQIVQLVRNEMLGFADLSGMESLEMLSVLEQDLLQELVLENLENLHSIAFHNKRTINEDY